MRAGSKQKFIYIYIYAANLSGMIHHLVSSLVRRFPLNSSQTEINI